MRALIKMRQWKDWSRDSLSLFADFYSTDRSKAVVPVLVILCCFVVYSTRRFVLYLTLCHFVRVFFSPFSIVITSLGEERANLSAFRTFDRFVLVCICQFPLPRGVWEGLRFVIVALPGLFSYPFLSWFCYVQRSWKWYCIEYQFSHARQHELFKNVPSEIALSANRIIWQNRMYKWRANSRMRFCACANSHPRRSIWLCIVHMFEDTCSLIRAALLSYCIVLRVYNGHYENTPIQIYRKFHLQKLKIFRQKESDIFHISAQNIDCGYSLEPPRRGGSNKCP